ncbi:ABC transporter ATP-binding protein [Actinacidiphila oryziradicis]|uniref:ABC transporter ATP-binding protein n=1 Tax=Actinacidiphila oryziradicis TaxID=2571141 RepID=A0A4U0SKC8_9ACTN|nr:ABC transporter ATP-binding protein [Actinacidiphila oryziradicis]TKA10274.1 ABC transporter ATP-binding protein [Actinacidiphila oryziradicis]
MSITDTHTKEGAGLQPEPSPAVGAQLLQLARPWSARLLLIAAAVLGAAVLGLLPSLIVRHVVDHNLTAHRTAGLAPAALLYLAVSAAVAMLTAAYGYLAATVAQRSLAGLRTRLFSHLLHLPTGYHDRTAVGDSISRCTADVEAIDALFSSSVATLLGQTVQLVTVTVTMLVLSPALTVVAAVFMPPVALLTGYLRRRIRDAERDTRRAIGLLNTHLQEDLSGAEVIRAFGRQTTFTNRFRLALTDWLRATNKSTFYNAFYAPGLGLLSAFATALLVWLSSRNAFDTIGVSLGTLTAFILLFAQFITPLINLGDEWQSVQAALAGAERVFSVLALPVDVHAGPAPAISKQAISKQGKDRLDHHGSPADGPALEVDRITFGYTPGAPVLHEVSVAVHPGEHVVVVGRTGAGKTSLLALLAGLYTPWAGHVHVAGCDPRTLDDAARRATLGFVPQTVQLFSGTVQDNLTLGDQTITAERARQAATLAGADRFIRTLPEGYDTVLSVSGRGTGVQLSAGQRQLLALARALVTAPAALLLDEATAVIDGASDAAFRAALHEHVTAAGTAVLTVAHRLATARDADRVVVMAGGRIVEQGTPGELLASGGRFATLIALEDAGWDWQHDLDEP